MSGNGKARWGLEVSDRNKENKIYYSAEPFNVKVPTWVNFQSSYTVPIGVAYVRLYCEVGVAPPNRPLIGSTMPTYNSISPMSDLSTLPKPRLRAAAHTSAPSLRSPAVSPAVIPLL